MECSLCGAYNDAAHIKCIICDSELALEGGNTTTLWQSPNLETQEVKIEIADYSKQRFDSKKICFFLAIIILVALPWAWNYKIFIVPADVLASRDKFLEIKEKFSALFIQEQPFLEILQNKNFENMEALISQNMPSEISPELAMSIFTKLLQQKYPDSFQGAAISCAVTDDGSIQVILSKARKFLFFWEIIDALEIHFVQDVTGVHCYFIRFTTGSEEKPVFMAWERFNKEIRSIKCLEQWFYSLQKLDINKNHSNEIVFSPIYKDRYIDFF